MYCRKFNAEFNKLIRTVRHRARFFQKMILNTSTIAQKIWLYLDIFIFSLIKSLSCNKTLKVLGLYVVCINRMSLHNKFTQKCSWFRAKNIDEKVYILQIKKNNGSIESWFFSYEDRYTYYESKKAKKSICHRTTFYSIFNMIQCKNP